MIPNLITSEAVSGSGVALLRAVAAGRPRQVRLLLDAGASANQPDECGQTPLIKAIFVENPRTRQKIVQLLLRYGATVSRSDVVGRNALSWACYYGRDKVVEMCVKNRDVDLDLNMSDINGCTALFHAATSGSAACVKNIIDILDRYAMSVDVPNFNGITPLMQSLRLGHDISASILMNQGKASTTVRDANFLSAADWADRVHGKKSHVEGFLPEIFKVTQQSQAAEPRKSYNYKPHHQGSSGGSLSAEDTDDEDDSTYGSSSDGSWAEIIAEIDIANSPPTKRRSSPTITFGRTPINSPTPAKTTSGYQSGDEDFEFFSSSIPAADTPVKNKPDKSQIEKNNYLPELYTMFSNQLSQTYRPGHKTVVRSDTRLDLDHDIDCTLECCGNRSRNLSAVSSQSLPTIRLPEKRIQGLVAANRQERSNTAETTGKTCGT